MPKKPKKSTPTEPDQKTSKEQPLKEVKELQELQSQNYQLRVSLIARNQELTNEILIAGIQELQEQIPKIREALNRIGGKIFEDYEEE